MTSVVVRLSDRNADLLLYQHTLLLRVYRCFMYFLALCPGSSQQDCINVSHIQLSMATSPCDTCVTVFSQPLEGYTGRG